MRCGASSSTTARGSCARACTAVSRSPALLGRKPANTKALLLCAWLLSPPSATSPAALTSVMTLLAPGSGSTRWPAARTAAARRAPGSLTPGVPASLT
ncbi:hypothetical protein D3C85_145340 [compost metagenome]